MNMQILYEILIQNTLYYTTFCISNIYNASKSAVSIYWIIISIKYIVVNIVSVMFFVSSSEDDNAYSDSLSDMSAILV